MTADRARWIVLTTMFLLLLLGAAGTFYAMSQPDATARANVTLWMALAALIITIFKVLIDMFISPEDQAIRQRASRHEERAEIAAGHVRQLLGLSGTVVEGRARAAWDAHDATGLAEAASALGELAERAYHEMEQTSDPLEITIGVLMVESWELAQQAPSLADLPEEDWPASPAARYMANVTDYLEQVQRGLHEVQDRGRLSE